MNLKECALAHVMKSLKGHGSDSQRTVDAGTHIPTAQDQRRKLALFPKIENSHVKTMIAQLRSHVQRLSQSLCLEAREMMICQPGHLPTLFCLEDRSLLEGVEENGAEQGKRIGAVLSLYCYRAN